MAFGRPLIHRPRIDRHIAAAIGRDRPARIVGIGACALTAHIVQDGAVDREVEVFFDRLG